jgi:hypothetical protein
MKRLKEKRTRNLRNKGKEDKTEQEGRIEGI